MHVGFVSFVVENRDGQRHTGRGTQVLSHLFPCRLTAAGIVAVADAGRQRDGGVISGFGNVDVQIGGIDAQPAALDFRTQVQCFLVHFVDTGDKLHRCFIICSYTGDVELTVVSDFQQFFQLPFVIVDLGLGSHAVVLCTGSLCLQLSQVGFRNLPLLIHLLSASKLAFRRFFHGFVYV